MNYSRMPGTGDLPGDNTHPNSPDYVEPPYGRDDAAASVAARMARNGDLDALVEAVADSRALLDWIAHNAGVPEAFQAQFRELDAHARDLDKAVEAELAELNGADR